MKFVHYIVDAGGRVAVPAVAAASSEIGSAETAAKLSLEWEMEVTRQINALMDLAIKEGDHIAQEFLRWFVTEQLEEVSTMDELLSVIRRAGSGGLLFVEDYLARCAGRYLPFAVDPDLDILPTPAWREALQSVTAPAVPPHSSYAARLPDSSRLLYVLEEPYPGSHGAVTLR